MKIPESMKFVFKTLTIWGFVCLLIISTVGIPLADTDTRNRDTLYSASDCPSPPPGFRDTDKGYAQLSWTVNPRYQDHQLHCVYEDPTHAGKARAELHTYEAPEDGVKNIFNKGNAGKELKDMCQNVVIGLYGGWGEFLDNEADRFVVACGRPEIPPDKEYLEIIGRIRYNRSIIKIFVSGWKKI